MYKFGKEAIEVVALVAACVTFYVYLTEFDDRKKASQLQTLQLSQLCENLASTINGKSVWNYQEPKTFDEWDKSNSKLDERIASLNIYCVNAPNYVQPSRALRVLRISTD